MEVNAHKMRIIYLADILTPKKIGSIFVNKCRKKFV